MVLRLFCDSNSEKPTGVMIPVPHNPLYSASLTSLGLVKVNNLLFRNLKFIMIKLYLNISYFKFKPHTDYEWS